MKVKELQISGLSSRIYEPENEIKELMLAIHGFAGDKESSVIVAVAEMLTKHTQSNLY